MEIHWATFSRRSQCLEPNPSEENKSIREKSRGAEAQPREGLTSAGDREERWMPSFMVTKAGSVILGTEPVGQGAQGEET